MLHLGENIPAGGTPVLYSFRRCPYAMRARLAIHAANVTVEHREILLRDKAPEFLEASPKGTVPVVVTPAKVIEESLDIMLWALGLSDPENWLQDRDSSLAMITRNDGPFKQALDRYKYASRHDGDPDTWRAVGAEVLAEYDSILAQTPHLLGDHPRLADFAIFPFVRQFANTDRAWFDAQPWPHLHRWLNAHLTSPRFAAIMVKYPKWQAGDAPTLVP
ncbi:glutathione S-transferase [Litoreibacter arenae]|uniref:Glutathione S-transferase domain protein n=1 Tax=Litoreibacter arenae DSM 19593 TaxID=1123360 RepID=S9QDT3_9RHOB|nr:glutathione S-transferase [Litoreibacter arenae]EPX77753.1 Glutathione S-transferase domain protein [Litoreibacter arenae DSM 19593]